MDEENAFLKKMFDESGQPVPPVDVADMKKMWEYGRELQARHPGEQYAVGLGVWQQLLPPGADIMAISYRCSQLSMFELWLRAMWSGGEPSEAAFKAAATMELKRMAVGVVYKGDEILERFIEEVHKAAA
jgi:hypothetical protein